MQSALPQRGAFQHPRDLVYNKADTTNAHVAFDKEIDCEDTVRTHANERRRPYAGDRATDPGRMWR